MTPPKDIRGGDGAARRGGGAGPGTGREDRERNGGRQPIAALDLGTNNCRLLVVRPGESDETFTVLDAFSRNVRLGEGVGTSNRLSEDAQQRAIRALRVCAGKMRHHRVGVARTVATEACRRAENGSAFIRRVREETGIRLDVITPEDEARMAVAGCAPLIDPEAEQLLVFDIGGGSTELIWIDLHGMPAHLRPALVRAMAPMSRADDKSRAAASYISDWISVPMGVSTLHERFSHIGSDAMRFDCMSAHFETCLAPFAPYCVRDRAELSRKLQIIGVSGTATTFGAIHLGLKSYDRSRVDGLWLRAADAEAVADAVIALGPNGRTTHPGIGRGRSDLVTSGAAILMTILRLWPVQRMRIADRGLREGMLYGLLNQRQVRMPA